MICGPFFGLCAPPAKNDATLVLNLLAIHQAVDQSALSLKRGEGLPFAQERTPLPQGDKNKQYQLRLSLGESVRELLLVLSV